jgi:hypothetical protein
MRLAPEKQFLGPHLQNNQRKMDWRCGSSNRIPALHVQSTEFKPQSHQKKKKGKKEKQNKQKTSKWIIDLNVKCKTTKLLNNLTFARTL